MKYFAPNLMDQPDEADKETFLKIILKKRPEYVIIWDVIGKDVNDFYNRVYISQYVAIKGKTVFYSKSKHYATRAKTLFDLDEIVYVETSDKWEEFLPGGERFKIIKYFAPNIVDTPQKIALEDFILKILAIRPQYTVIWGINLEDLKYIVSRVYVVSIMPIIGDTLYYSFGKHFAYQAQKKFQISHRKKINTQNTFEQQIGS